MIRKIKLWLVEQNLDLIEKKYVRTGRLSLKDEDLFVRLEKERKKLTR